MINKLPKRDSKLDSFEDAHAKTVNKKLLS